MIGRSHRYPMTMAIIIILVKTKKKALSSCLNRPEKLIYQNERHRRHAVVQLKFLRSRFGGYLYRIKIKINGL